jgi:hypothetical protein
VLCVESDGQITIESAQFEAGCAPACLSDSEEPIPAPDECTDLRLVDCVQQTSRTITLGAVAIPFARHGVSAVATGSLTAARMREAPPEMRAATRSLRATVLRI